MRKPTAATMTAAPTRNFVPAFIGPLREGRTNLDYSRTNRSRKRGSLPARRGGRQSALPHVVHDRLVGGVLRTRGAELGIVMTEEVGVRRLFGRSVMLPAADRRLDDVAEEVAGIERQDAVAQRLRARDVAGVEAKQGGVVAGIGVDAVELLVGEERHRRKAGDGGGVTRLRGPHAALVEAVEALAGTHLADVGRGARVRGD